MTNLHMGSGGLVAKSCPNPAIQWTVACWAPLSTGFSRQQCWSGLPFPFPDQLPSLGTEPRSPALQTDFLLMELPGKSYLWTSSYNFLTAVTWKTAILRRHQLENLLQFQRYRICGGKWVYPFG